jgi:hypothetical protein
MLDQLHGATWLPREPVVIINSDGRSGPITALMTKPSAGLPTPCTSPRNIGFIAASSQHVGDR